MRLPLPLTVCLALASAFSLHADPRDAMTKGTIQTEGVALPYRLHLPEMNEDKSLPLIIFLHGAGERGTDNQAQLRHGVKSILEWCDQSDNPCILVAPQCPKKEWWADLEFETTKLPKFEKPSPELAAVFALIDQLIQEHPVDQGRIYLTGLSMGGYGTWDAVWRKPDLFAAAIPICGGGVVSEAGRCAQLPIWVFHGDRDATIPVIRSREMVEALQAAGGKPRYTEYPGVGHDSWTKTYADEDVLQWLFRQRRESKAQGE